MPFITFNVTQKTYDKMIEVMKETKTSQERYLKAIIKAAVFSEPVVLRPNKSIIKYSRG